MKVLTLLVAWVVFAAASTSWAGPNRGATSYRTYKSAGWNILESDNFRFCCRGPLGITDAVVRTTESLRQELAEQWLEASSATAWKPKCDIVLHSTSEAYEKAVPGGGQTVGSSVINMEGGRIMGRRIDIRADRSGWLRAALAHELTHIVLADHFPDGRLPAWADEGMAVLADTDVKQDAHQRDLNSAQSHRQTFRLVELFALDGYPAAERQAAFYGQSASLVRYLVGRGTPEQFVRFVRSAASDGYEAAVRDVYGLRGVHDLERRWLQEVNTFGTVAKNDRSVRRLLAD